MSIIAYCIGFNASAERGNQLDEYHFAGELDVFFGQSRARLDIMGGDITP